MLAIIVAQTPASCHAMQTGLDLWVGGGAGRVTPIEVHSQGEIDKNTTLVTCTLSNINIGWGVGGAGRVTPIEVHSP